MYDASKLDVSVLVSKLLEYREALLKGGVGPAEIQELSFGFQGNLAMVMMDTRKEEDEQQREATAGEAWKGPSHESARLAAAAQAIVKDWDDNHLAPHPSAPPDDLEMHFHELRQALKGTE